MAKPLTCSTNASRNATTGRMYNSTVTKVWGPVCTSHTEGHSCVGVIREGVCQSPACISSSWSARFPHLSPHLQVQEVRVVKALAEVVQAAEHVLKVFCQLQCAGGTAGARWGLLLMLGVVAALVVWFGLQKGAVRQWNCCGLKEATLHLSMKEQERVHSSKYSWCGIHLYVSLRPSWRTGKRCSCDCWCVHSAAPAAMQTAGPLLHCSV